MLNGSRGWPAELLNPSVTYADKNEKLWILIKVVKNRERECISSENKDDSFQPSGADDLPWAMYVNGKEIPFIRKKARGSSTSRCILFSEICYYLRGYK